MKKSKDAQIVELTAEVETLKNNVAELDKKLKSSESTKDSWYKVMNDKDKELKQLHDLLDVLPNPIARQTGDAETPSYNRSDRTVMERLVAYLVRR